MSIIRHRPERSLLMADGSTGAKLDILLIEDQRAVAMVIEAMLHEQLNCRVTIAGTLRETEQILADRQDFFIAITDLHLPDANLGEVIDVVAGTGIPQIAMTGTFSDELREVILRKGVVDYVLKDGPLAFSYIVSLVERIYRNSHCRVLVVDDSTSTRALLKHSLSLQKFMIEEATDGEAALARLAVGPSISLVLVDYVMPKMDGIAFTSAARGLFGKEDLVIIGISAADNDRLSAQFLKYGANDFISKPYSYEELLCRVTQNLSMLELIQQNRYAATRDYLTGLYNRRHFFREGSLFLNAAKREGTPVTAAMIDIDHFKRVNDSCGHDTGDQVLRHVAGMLVQHFPDQLVARLGGEEFAVLFHGTTPEAVRHQLEGFRHAVQNTPIALATDAIAITVSGGIGHSGLADDTLDRLLQGADQNLYVAKEGGRNAIVG
jgi:diguanylate cyclase (GGDEF)-like protein